MSLLLLACALYSFGNQDIASTLVLYLNYRFGWTPEEGIPTVFTVMGSLLVVWETLGTFYYSLISNTKKEYLVVSLLRAVLLQQSIK